MLLIYYVVLIPCKNFNLRLRSSNSKWRNKKPRDRPKTSQTQSFNSHCIKARCMLFYFQPLPEMLNNPFELNRECLPVGHTLTSTETSQYAKYLTLHCSLVLRIKKKQVKFKKGVIISFDFNVPNLLPSFLSLLFTLECWNLNQYLWLLDIDSQLFYLLVNDITHFLVLVLTWLHEIHVMIQFGGSDIHKLWLKW